MDKPWTVQWRRKAAKELAKPDKTLQKAILRYLDERIVDTTNPRAFGKALRHEKWGLWRYRVGSARIIVHLENGVCIVLVVAVGQRKDIYHY